ncbi:MAG: hypothetical protein JXA10_07900 [Anaerolineae bacterium]|nr:hypothetical protein [Anaerolineae bacterium]
MARRKKAQETPDPNTQQGDSKKPIRHPLLVYYNLGKRYRGPGIFMVIIGLIFFLPVVVSDLESPAVKKETLALVGLVLFLSGLGLWMISQLARRQAYIQCRSDLLEIRTPFYRTLISYLRINQVQSVQVSKVFDRDELKGTNKPLMLPLMSMTAVEMHVRSWPAPKKRLQRMLNKYMFSPRAEAWIFIVPNYSLLMREIEAAAQLKAAEDKSTSYEDPFERLKYYTQ